MSQARTLEEFLSNDYHFTKSRMTTEELNKNLKNIIIDAFALKSITKYKCDQKKSLFKGKQEIYSVIDYDKITANAPVSTESQKFYTVCF